MRFLAATLGLVGLVASAPAALSADMMGVPVASHCVYADNARLLSIPQNAALTSEVVRLMDEAVAVADDPRWVNSSRPAFVWASEAKAACGIAYGYLKAQYRDDEFLNKCECFHGRMVQYMN